jgi:hypothetical protein
MNRGELAFVEVGNRRLVEPAEIRRFVADHRRRGRPVKGKNRPKQPVFADSAAAGVGDDAA